jgi:hypothetical protein
MRLCGQAICLQTLLRWWAQDASASARDDMTDKDPPPLSVFPAAHFLAALPPSGYAHGSSLRGLILTTSSPG